jgi:non-heme chloroperoxidase
MLKHRGHREKPECTEKTGKIAGEPTAMMIQSNMARSARVIFAIFAALCVVAPTVGASMSESGFVTSTDGVKIHYIEAGRPKATSGVQPTILFVPGWTMPAWIWQKQIDHFAAKYHVVAIDPRCQGESSQTSEGLYPAQMARDIKAVVDQLHLAPVVLVGWSMAVVETLSYVDQFGTRDVAGLVFVDELAGGFAPGEAEQDFSLLKDLLQDHKNTADYFVRKIQFHKPQPEEYIRRVIQASLSVPTASAVALLVGRYAADYRAVLPKIDKPTLVCAAKGFYFDRVVEMQNQIPGSKLEVFEGAGHALFVDNSEQFNSALDSFLGSLK